MGNQNRSVGFGRLRQVVQDHIAEQAVVRRHETSVGRGEKQCLTAGPYTGIHHRHVDGVLGKKPVAPAQNARSLKDVLGVYLVAKVDDIGKGIDCQDHTFHHTGGRTAGAKIGG